MPITLEQSSNSYVEFSFSLCPKCVEDGHKAGKGYAEKKDIEPRPTFRMNQKVRDICRKIDESETWDNAVDTCDSQLLDKDLTDIERTTIRHYLKFREYELLSSTILPF